MAFCWAALNLLFAACNDFVFKLYRKDNRSIGAFIAVIGYIWAIVLLGINGGPGLGNNPGATVLWGAISGFFSITANILLISAMGLQSMGVTSTIYRMNLVPVTILAWLLLGEKLSPMQITGILMALAAILFFFPWHQKGEKNRQARIGLILAIAAMLLRAFMGISYRYAFTHGAAEAGVTFVNSLCWILGGTLWYFIREHRKAVFGKKEFYYGIVSGLLVFGICITMAFALSGGKASLVLPVMQMSFILTFLFGWLFLHEKITWLKVAGALTGAAGILLLSLS